MKKLLMLVLCGGLLVACSSESSYTVKITSPDDVLLSGSEIEITKQQYFEKLLDAYGSNELLNEAVNAIADKELTDQSAIDTALNEKITTYKEYAGGDLNAYAIKMGYSSQEEYVQLELLPMVKLELLRKKYIDENLDELIKTYQVCSFKKIVVDKESTALNIIKEATTAEAFDAKVTEYGTAAEDAGIVTKNSTLDDNLKEQLETLSAISEDGVYSKAIKLSDDSYAVVYMYNTDHSNKDKIISSLSSDSKVQTAIEGGYLKEYNFKIYDDKLKDAIKKISEDYIVE